MTGWADNENACFSNAMRGPFDNGKADTLTLPTARENRNYGKCMFSLTPCQWTVPVKYTRGCTRSMNTRRYWFDTRWVLARPARIRLQTGAVPLCQSVNELLDSYNSRRACPRESGERESRTYRPHTPQCRGRRQTGVVSPMRLNPGANTLGPRRPVYSSRRASPEIVCRTVAS